jgi:hypothetical protein
MRWDESRENDGSGQKLAPRRQDAKGGSSSTTENGVARIVVDAAVRVHQVLGPGLLESVYEIVLAFDDGGFTSHAKSRSTSSTKTSGSTAGFAPT